MRKTRVTDDALCQAVSEIIQGLVDADLGGYVVKKRVAIPGRGKRGGARTLLATRMEDRWFFLFGFAKNERSNIDKNELKALQELAREYLGLSNRQLDKAVESGKLTEICHDYHEAQKSNLAGSP
jgi:hypothetical protein